ncbi:MAG: hypothetical protein K6F00_11235 [Lachnospiraceae bacterium]|nr:hypothetical protein [Lachnospiraceae bacterium]
MSDAADLIEGKVIKDQKAFDDYIKAEDKLVAMQKQGKLLIIEADDEEKPYVLHCIYIKPGWDNDDDWEVSATELASVLRLMDKIVISKGIDTIQLSKRIYSQEKGV